MDEAHEPLMARPEHRQAAIRAHRDRHLGVSWGVGGALSHSGWAEKKGWKLPAFFGFKKAFIKKMLETDKNFEEAIIQSGVDVYIPPQYIDEG